MRASPVSTQVEDSGSREASLLGARIGQYEIIRLLGRGGMGEVHLARDLRLGRLVALKLLTTQAPDLDERFLAEARATARCHHENIVVIHEVGAHRTGPYMVLEYLEGQTLRQWLNEYALTAGSPARVPPVRAIELMLPVVRALAYAHDQGIVHRDLKPENVMLTRTGVTKVLDFGIAKLLAPAADAGAGGDPRSAPDSSVRAGTLPYMSPEQITLGAIDHRSDVWAAGIMLFELVAGVRPVLEATAPLTAIIMGDTPMPSASERLPELGPLAQIIDRCLIKPPAHRTPSAQVLLAELEALAPRRRPVVRDGGSPFAGLAAFQEADAGRFFGRDRDIDLVVAALRSRPLVAVVGPSGAGKSSLVRAGVIPALKRSGEGWDAHTVRPGREPLAALASVLVQLESAPENTDAGVAHGDSANSAVLARLRAEPGSLGARLRARATSKRRRIAVFVDQLEELYTLGVPADERAAFLACLAAVADDPSAPLRVLVSMRSDFLDRLTEDPRLGGEVTGGLILLPPMHRDGLREALLRPVEASEHRFEPLALVDRMIEAVADARGALPLLQFTAARLWERRDRERRALTETSYEALGGVGGALAWHADDVLARMSAAQRALARAMLERLVTPERTRALVNAAELHLLSREAGLVDEVLQHLAAMRLVVIERSVDAEAPMVELVHESLIDRWPTLRQWLDENQDDVDMLARLRTAARDWERSGHAAGLLWTGAIAAEACAWQPRYRGELASTEQRYLAAVRAAIERARRVRQRWWGAIGSAVVLVAILMAWLAWKQTAAGERAAREAKRARDATRMTAIRALAGNPTTQLALLREMEDIAAPPPGALQEAKRLLHAGVAPVVLMSDAALNAAAFSPDGQRVASASDDKTVRVWSVDGSRELRVLRGHEEAVWSAVFSPDGQRIASASSDRTVRIWRVDERSESGGRGPTGSAGGEGALPLSIDGGGDPLVLRGHDAVVWSAAFSPDGARIVSASDDKTVRVWRVDGGDAPVVLRGHDAGVRSAAFSPDGQRIVSASRDKTVRVWRVDGRREPLVLRGHGAVVYAAAFSPDGQRIVSASADKLVRVWHADGSGDALVLRGHDDTVTSVAFSPDGRHIVSASSDKTVRIWNADGRGEPLILRGHDEVIWSVAFSRDGRRIVSASNDQTLWVWNVQPSGEPLVLRGHDDEVWSAGFSRDGRRIVSTSVDKTVRVWDADGRGEPLVLRGHDARVTAAAFSPDGRRVASASWDKTVRVWNLEAPQAPLILRGHDDSVVSVAFSPDGQRIVSASYDRTVRVWDADGRGEPLVLRGHEDSVRSAVFSPDGRRIASGAYDRTVRLWSADGRGAPLILRGHSDDIYAVAFSPDGQRVVSASLDKTVRVWRADGESAPRVLRHGDWVLSAEIGPDGRQIVSASKDMAIRIWNADGSGEPVVLIGHDLAVEQARFSPDGRSIVSASRDHTVRVWHDLAPAALNDPRLWAATSYCMPVERRVRLLSLPEEQAMRDLQRCEAHIRRAGEGP